MRSSIFPPRKVDFQGIRSRDPTNTAIHSVVLKQTCSGKYMTSRGSFSLKEINRPESLKELNRSETPYTWPKRGNLCGIGINVG